MAMPSSAFGGAPAAAWRRADVAKMICIVAAIVLLLATFFASPGLGAVVFGVSGGTGTGGGAGGGAGAGSGGRHSHSGGRQR